MRIGDKTGPLGIKGRENKGEARRRGATGSSAFAGRLTELVGVQAVQEIGDLKQRIDEAGDLLDREPTIANFRIFRELLGDLTRAVTGMAYRLEKIGGTPADPRYLEAVTVIDRQADQLYRLVMHEQQDRMRITSKIMELKGLVIDLMS